MMPVVLALGWLLYSALSSPLVHAVGLFKIGENAPAFTLTAITGETISLDSYKSKVVVLGLFHICDPCMMQGSALQRFTSLCEARTS